MSRRGLPSRLPATRFSVTTAALTALLVVSIAGTAAPAPATTGPAMDGEARDRETWRSVLLRAADASQQRRYSGEALTIVWSAGVPQVSLVTVQRDRETLTVSSTGQFTVRLGEQDSELVDHRQGWMAPLPAIDPGGAAEAIRALAAKYDVAVAGQERLLDRPCARIEVRRRADGSLRERLWVDEDSGLVLRRESYEGDERLRLMAYMSLDLRSGQVGRASTRVTRSGRAGLQRRAGEVSAVDMTSLSALHRAGWTVPTDLPGGYEPSSAYVVDRADGQPLQVVYGDGLYTVSLFQQRGRADWTSLPEGAEPVEGLDWVAYEWPGAVPRRLVWEAEGTTFSLVGDAPPEEFIAIAEALPRPQGASLGERLRRGLSRVLSWVPQ